jgi:hypothetical protein
MAYSLNNEYVRFDVKDYTGSSVLSSFTLDETPLTFEPVFDQTKITADGGKISNKNIRWDFGDGTFSTELYPTHTYKWPGEYTVTLTVFDNTGKAYDSSYAPQVQIYDYISTQIAFKDYERFVYDVPAGRFIGPLSVITYNSWQNNKVISASGCTINLYASGAKGDYNYIPASSKDKWSHLRTLSRFYKTVTINGIESYEEIESIQAPQTEIYGKIQNNSIEVCSPNDTGSIFLGTTGFCEFWYTDERPGNYTTEDNPIFIFATIDNAKFNDAFTERTNAFEYIDYPPYGYQNMQPAIFPGIKSRYNSANHLSVTTTGIDGEGTLSTTQFEIPKISWQETDIPFVIKFKDALGYTTKNYPPLSSSYVQKPTISPVSAYDVQFGVGTYNVSGALIPLTGVTFYEDFDPNTLPQSTGAFYKGYLKAAQSSENCVLTAAVNVIEPAFYVKDALVGWIGIPQYNSSFRILRQEVYNQYKFGTKTVTFTDNQALFPTDDNRNIYAIAVAPVGAVPENDYQTWIADSVNDRILKYDIYGNALPVYYTLSASGDYIPNYYYSLSAIPTVINNQVIISDFRTPSISGFPSIASPNSIAIDKSNNVWVTLLDSGTAIKINTSTGYVTTIAHTAPLSGNTSLSTTVLSSAYTSLSGFAGENIVLPASIDIDQDNNAWITYTHPLFSRIVKYQGEDNDSPIANILATFSFPEGISPDEICIDRNKCVWVTALNHNYDRGTFNTSSDLLYKFDLNCNLLSGFPLSGFKQIGNLTIDGYQNAWVSQDRETITQIDNTSLRMTNYIAGSGNNDTNYIGSIGGITCDTSNYIWVINNFDKKMYLIDSERPPGDYLSYRYSIDLKYPTLALPVVSYLNYDPDYEAYIQLADITNYIAQNQIYQFIIGVKNLGLWDNIICWPMISTQNARTGTTVYPFGGLSAGNTALYGALSGSTPTRTLSGLQATSNNSYVQTNIPFNATTIGEFSVIGVGNIPTGSNNRMIGSNTAATIAQSTASTNNAYGSYDGGGTEFNITSATNNTITHWVNITKNSTTSRTGYINSDNGRVTTTTLRDINSKIAFFGSNTTSNDGIYSFFAWSNKQLTTAQNRALYDLYRSTLGSGLIGFGTGSVMNVDPSLPPITPTPNTYSDGLQAFQAYGDWNGYRWINKYSVPYNTVRTITGSSNLFDIYPDTGAFNITKVNENWNASGYYNSLRYQESLLDKQVFFDQFLGVILGGLNAQPYELGKTVYEKIANFVDNRVDIDKCNLDALLDLCKELSIEFEEYNYLFPPQVRRLVDMLSIKQSNLWGTRNKYNLNFDNRGTIFPNDAYGINLGTEINPLTGYFAFDTPVVAYEIFSGNYKLVNTNYINSDVTYLPVITSYNSIEDYTTVYSNLIALSSYTSDWGWSLVAPDDITGTAITGYYKFYNYKPADIDTYYNNIIDWKDLLTTLSPTNSSYNTWSNDNGIMQNMFSYELTKGFKLFTSAANIIYNS